jgi:hypothetical protein
MSVIFVGGVPGSGKTLFCTSLAKSKFKKENFLRRKKVINNVFSNFPIQLSNYFSKRKKYKKVKVIDKVNGKLVKNTHLIDKNSYSRSCTLTDFNVYHKYIPDSVFIFDEFHAMYDSLDYKSFPRKVAKTFQFHRHFGIKDIYCVCQHPSRLVKQVRILVDEFYRIKKFIKIPIIGIGIFKYTIYYNFEDYGKSTKVKKEDVQYDFNCKIKIVRYKKLFKSYDTKYMKALVEESEYLESKPYKSLTLTKEDIKNNFNMSE